MGKRSCIFRGAYIMQRICEIRKREERERESEGRREKEGIWYNKLIIIYLTNSAIYLLKYCYNTVDVFMFFEMVNYSHESGAKCLLNDDDDDVFNTQ